MEKDYFFDVTLVMLLLLMLAVRLMPEIAADLLLDTCTIFLFVLAAIIIVRESLLLRDALQSVITEWRLISSVRFALMLILCIVSIALALK